MMLSGDPDVQKRARANGAAISRSAVERCRRRWSRRSSRWRPPVATPRSTIATSRAMKASAAQPEEYYRFFNALAAFSAPELRERTLKFALSAEARSQDTPLLIAQLLGSEGSQDATWDFRQGQVAGADGEGRHLPGHPGDRRRPRRGYCSAAKSDEIKKFFDAHPVPEAARCAATGLRAHRVLCRGRQTRQSPAFDQVAGGAETFGPLVNP